MQGYIEFIKKHRTLLRIVLVVTILIAINGVRQIQLGSAFDVFVPKASQYGDRMDEMASYFPTSDQLMVMIEAGEMDEPLYEQFVQFNAYVKSKNKDIIITGPITEDNPDNITPASLMTYAQMMSMMGDMSPVTKLDGQTYYTFTLFSETPLTKSTIDALEDWLKDADFSYAMSGDTYVQLKVFDYITFIITRIPPLAMGILLLIFYLRIRTFKGTMLSLLPAGIGSLWTMGLIGYLGQEVSIITVLAPIFTIVIGSADGLHFVTHVQEEQVAGKSPVEALTHTLHMVGLPMIITTITSMAGFLALMVMNTAAVINLAIFASMGIFLAGIATWYVLPLILTGGMKLGKTGPSNKQKPSILKQLWGRPIVPIILVVLLIFGLGVSHLNQEFNMLGIYKPSTEIYKSVEKITEVNGGALPVFIYGDIPEGEHLFSIASDVIAFEDGLRSDENIGKVNSSADIIGNIISTSLPNASQMDMSNLDLSMIPTEMLNQLDLSLIRQFVNFSDNKIRMMVLPVNHDNDTLQAIHDYVEMADDAYGMFHFKETGVGFMMMELNSSMMQNQITSSLLAVALVFLLLWLSLKHIKSALVSLIPIMLTLLTLFGVMGLFDISLNLISSTIFSISIGVGIDYAIHFTSVWRTRIHEGMPSEAAADNAFRYTYRPILANAFGLSLGFSALFLSPLQIHTTVATLMWVAMISSVLFSLVILPTILRKV